MRILILHGIMGKAGENWAQWLHDELISCKFEVAMPNLPEANHPDRKEWLATVKKYASDDTADLVIVAHSLGVTSALDFIENAKKPVKALVSVSGFAEDYGLELNSYFLKAKSVNFNAVNKKLQNAFAFYGDNDPYVSQEALRSLAKNLHIKPIVIKGGGHLNTDTGFTKFPQLLKTVLSIK